MRAGHPGGHRGQALCALRQRRGAAAALLLRPGPPGISGELHPLQDHQAPGPALHHLHPGRGAGGNRHRATGRPGDQNHGNPLLHRLDPLEGAHPHGVLRPGVPADACRRVAVRGTAGPDQIYHGGGRGPKRDPALQNRTGGCRGRHRHHPAGGGPLLALRGAAAETMPIPWRTSSRR